MKKLISLGILITLLGGCNSNVSTNNSSSSLLESSSVISSSSSSIKVESSSSSQNNSVSTNSSTSEENSSSSSISSSIVYEEKTLIINPSNFNKLSEIELSNVVENKDYPQEFTFNSLGVLKTNKLKGLKKLEMHVYSTYENLKVYESYTGSGSALKSNKVTGSNEATYTYDLSGGNELYILNDTSTHRTHVYEIKITYTGVNGSTGNNNSSSSNKDSSSFTSSESSSNSYIESDWYNGDYYDDVNFSLVDNNLFLELRDLISSTHTKTISYGDLRYNTIAKADASLKDSSKIVMLYSRKELSSTWDNGTTWNREHVWPQSVGWWGKASNSSKNAGSDLHHVRPETPSVNNDRGNKAFGTKSGQYLPVDEAKGDVARILFYMLTRYSETDSKSITVVAESMDLLLKWNKLDPVDDLEKQRNNVGEEIQGNRNPFIDYPEFADKIWG